MVTVDRCPVCNAPTVRVERYDAYACMACRKWIEAACDEDTCDLCRGRPVEPPRLEPTLEELAPWSVAVNGDAT